MSGGNKLSRFAACVFGLLIVMEAGTFAYANYSPTFIVFAIESGNGNSNLAWLGEGISYSISEQIAVPGINVIDYKKRSELADDLDLPPTTPLSRASMIRLAERAAADYLVMGSFSGTSANLRIVLRLLDLKTMSFGGDIVANGQLSILPQMENELAWLILSNSGLNAAYSRIEFKKKTRLIPNRSYAYFIRSLSTSDRESRLKNLSKAVEFTPNYPDAQFLLGKDCFEAFDWKGAAQHLEYAIKDSKYFQNAAFMLGTSYLQQGLFEQSIKSYSSLLALKESQEVLNNLGVAYLRKGDYSAAHLQLLRAQNMARMSATVQINLALLRHLQGKNSEARNILQDILSTNPDSGVLLYVLSKVLEAMGEKELAKEAADKARHLGVNIERMNAEAPGDWARVFWEWDLR